MKSILAFRIHLDPPRARPWGIIGRRDGDLYTTTDNVIYQLNSRIFKSGDFKNEISFHFRIHSDPPRMRLVGIIGEAGGLRPIHCKKVIYQF